MENVIISLRQGSKIFFDIYRTSNVGAPNHDDLRMLPHRTTTPVFELQYDPEPPHNIHGKIAHPKISDFRFHWGVGNTVPIMSNVRYYLI